MIHARRQHPAFGLGDFHDLGGSNPSVLSYAREHTAADGGTDLILCVNNLSRFPQPVELDLRRYEGTRARRAARRGAVPRDRRAALPADAVAATASTGSGSPGRSPPRTEPAT